MCVNTIETVRANKHFCYWNSVATIDVDMVSIAYSLPALQKKGHLVEIVLPKYHCKQYDRVYNLRALSVEIESYFDHQLYKSKIWVGSVVGLPVYFIEPQHPSKFFWRGKFYGEHDDFRRFSFFSRAALEFLLQAGKKPNIIHCHDWQTAFIAPLYWEIFVHKGLNSARICFTCHNFEYQGTAAASELDSCGLVSQNLNQSDKMQDNSARDRVNSVKGGHGLHSTLSSHSRKFIGILNGIDTDAWNPATDEFLPVQYNATDLHGKVENKQALRRKLGLSSADIRRPLVIGRILNGLGCTGNAISLKPALQFTEGFCPSLQQPQDIVLQGSGHQGCKTIGEIWSFSEEHLQEALVGVFYQERLSPQ
ncbi:probable starch synthase 4, chloroplastic/amyloplastic [Vigna angularis]|uniref:probable starch synthase 4, chloroplastic/amyloplastic n=1 Tax=Phaseolus angularis TaxID=3914 RepID=UPI0022B5BEC0|nr:probable starch synthase 4, chloroplastic/amyloplastic [Vigna angularis]